MSSIRTIIILLPIVSAFFFSCVSDEEKALRDSLKSDIGIDSRDVSLTRGINALQYCDVEKSMNKQYVESLEKLVNESFEKQIDYFDKEELGFLSSYRYMFKYIFSSKQKWEDDLRLKSNKYFNTIDTKQQLYELYYGYRGDVENLRRQLVSKKINVMPTYKELDLPNEEISLGNLKSHTLRNIMIEIATDTLVLLFIMLIVLILSIFIDVAFPPNIVVTILTIIVSVFLSIRNDNKLCDSLREQHKTVISLDYNSILHDLDRNTTYFYEQYR